jgi:hypothetical protein
VTHALLDSHSAGAASDEVKAELKAAIREAAASQRIPAGAENRMLPSAAAKERHRPLERKQ